MICPKCKKEIAAEEASRFCPECGAEIGCAAEAASVPEAASEAASQAAAKSVDPSDILKNIGPGTGNPKAFSGISGTAEPKVDFNN